MRQSQQLIRRTINNYITQSRKLHWLEYGAEFLGTTLFIFCGLSAVVFNFGKGLPMEHFIPNNSVRLLLTGLLFAGGASLVTISPLGKLSGGHLNPAVSLAFWLQGKMHHHDIGGYIIGQFLGAILGTVLLVFVWGDYAASVHNGITFPGTAYPLWFVFLAEVSMTFLLVLSIFIFVSSHRLMRWTPLMTCCLMATMVCLGAPISGTSVNPARSFGPALVSWFWQDHWLYWIAPPIGAMAAVGAFRLLYMSKRQILTAKLFHVPHYRCIFKNVKVPHLVL